MDIWISGYLDVWISGYLDIWISGYLDSGKNNLLLQTHSEILCGAALAEFFCKKEHFPCLLRPKTVFFQFYLNNL